MPKRTQINEYSKIKRAEDLDDLVKDKRAQKRASKERGKRRNRHYTKTLLRHLAISKSRDETDEG